MSAATAAVRTARISSGRFRPELEFLLAATAGQVTRSRAPRFEQLPDLPLDWEFLLDFAEAHALAPLFFSNIESLSDAIPALFFARLRSRYEANVRKNLLLSNILLEVQKMLEDGGVASMAFKGPALASILYGDIALREFSDIDLLVRRRDILQAKQILLAAGFTPVVPLTPAQERLCLKWDNEFPFHRGPHLNLLELQWRVAPYFYAVDFDLNAQFQRASLVNIGGVQCRALCPEDLLLVLCVHAAKHAWARLAWLCDIAWLLRTQNLDWTHVQQQAEELGIEWILLVTLALTRLFYDCGLPAFAQREIKECLEVQRLTLKIADHIVHQQHIDISSREYFVLMCRVRERWRDRIRFLTRLAFTPGPGEWLTLSLPRFLAPAYIPVRMARLLAKFVPHPQK